MYSIDFLLLVSIVGLAACAIFPSSLNKISFFFIPLVILIVILSSQYTIDGFFVSGEMQGHFSEVSFCQSGNNLMLTYIEPLKNFIVFVSCRYGLPNAFDFLFKFSFVVVAILLARFSLLIGANPLLPISFLSFPILYGNNRSSLAALFICLSFCMFSFGSGLFSFSMRRTNMYFKSYVSQVKSMFRNFIILILPALPHASGFIFIPVFLVSIGLRSFYGLSSLKIRPIAIAILLLSLIGWQVFFQLLSQLDYIAGKPVALYINEVRDSFVFWGLPVKHLVIIVFPILMLKALGQCQGCALTRKLISNVNAFSLTVLIFVIICALFIGVDVSSRISFLFVPLIYLLTSYVFQFALYRTAFSSVKVLRILFYAFSLFLLLSYSRFPYSISPLRSFLGYPPISWIF